MKTANRYKWMIHLVFILMALLCIIPFFLLVSISLSDEKTIVRYGFSLIPQVFSTAAYEQIFKQPITLVRAYLVTVIYAFGGTALSVTTMAMTGYALSRKEYSLKKPITIMLLITMFVNGGLIPSYIITTQVFRLGDSIWLYLIHGMSSAYTIFVFRTFFSGIPVSLIESVRLDGANEVQILTKIIVPLSKPVLATFAFMGLVQRWNDYTVSMYYMVDPKKYTLQYLLQQILNEAKFLNELKASLPQIADSIEVPSETLKFAMCIVAVAPMLVVFPFFQKYFSKGMVVGAVKG